ncbi:DNA polymerase III subunit epsilon [Vreelandella sp. EE22]
MRLMDQHISLFGGSLRTLFKRESDRRRCMGSSFEWLFHPYLGEELVALAFRFVPDEQILSVAAVVFDQRRVHTRTAWVATLADLTRVKRGALKDHSARHGTTALMSPTVENISALAEFIGNRPVVGWDINEAVAPINRLFNARLGFDLPNTQVDVAKLYQRKQKRSHVEPWAAASFNQALGQSRLPVQAWPSLLSEASACALLYMRLQRDAALEA